MSRISATFIDCVSQSASGSEFSGSYVLLLSQWFLRTARIGYQLPTRTEGKTNFDTNTDATNGLMAALLSVLTRVHHSECAKFPCSVSVTPIGKFFNTIGLLLIIIRMRSSVQPGGCI